MSTNNPPVKGVRKIQMPRSSTSLLLHGRIDLKYCAPVEIDLSALISQVSKEKQGRSCRFRFDRRCPFNSAFWSKSCECGFSGSVSQLSSQCSDNCVKCPTACNWNTTSETCCFTGVEWSCPTKIKEADDCKEANKQVIIMQAFETQIHQGTDSSRRSASFAP